MSLSYILVRGLFTAREVSKMRSCAEQSVDIRENSYGRKDGQGRESRLCIWNYAGDDVIGVAIRWGRGVLLLLLLLLLSLLLLLLTLLFLLLQLLVVVEELPLPLLLVELLLLL